MIDNPELIEATELKILEVLQEAHTKGLSYERCDWLVGEVKKRSELRVALEIELRREK